jgi:hypothetical protein
MGLDREFCHWKIVSILEYFEGEVDKGEYQKCFRCNGNPKILGFNLCKRYISEDLSKMNDFNYVKVPLVNRLFYSRQGKK